MPFFPDTRLTHPVGAASANPSGNTAITTGAPSTGAYQNDWDLSSGDYYRHGVVGHLISKGTVDSLSTGFMTLRSGATAAAAQRVQDMWLWPLHFPPGLLEPPLIQISASILGSCVERGSRSALWMSAVLLSFASGHLATSGDRRLPSSSIGFISHLYGEQQNGSSSVLSSLNVNETVGIPELTWLSLSGNRTLAVGLFASTHPKFSTSSSTVGQLVSYSDPTALVLQGCLNCHVFDKQLPSFDPVR